MELIENAGMGARALREAELPPASSLYDDSPEIRALQDTLPEELTTALRRADWDFASRLIQLPPTTPDVADAELPYAGRLPAEVLLVREVSAPDGFGHIEWRIDERLLRVDVEPPLLIRATCTTTRESDLPTDFRKAVALATAAVLAGQFASSANRVERLERRADRAMRRALDNAADQASPRRLDGLDHDPHVNVDWVSAVSRPGWRP